MLHSTLSRVRDYLTPASNVSNFAETGQISPEEFVTAGDYLVNKFPTWSWVAITDPKKRTNDLPPEKQYLVLKHAPCHSRLDEGFSTWNPDEEDDEEGGGAAGKAQEVKGVAKETKRVEEEKEEDSDDEIPDMDDDDDDDDDDAVVRKPSGKTKRCINSRADPLQEEKR